MAILAISRMGHPALRAGTREVRPDELAGAEIQRLIDDMIDTMRDAEGVGLAAPQVYRDLRLLVAEVRTPANADDERSPVPVVALANPSIVAASEEMAYGWEGCLSIPEIRGIVPRHETVVVTGLDRSGRELTLECEGFLARIVQHEIDHLDGTLFLDRMDDLTTLTYLREFERYWTEAEEEEADG